MNKLIRFLFAMLLFVPISFSQTTKSVKQLKQKQHHIHLLKSVLKPGYKLVRFLTF